MSVLKIRNLSNDGWIALGVDRFLNLVDVDEITYSGHGGKLVKVNATEDGLDFNGVITISPVEPTGYDGEDGDIWLKY
jgi:hypothetical protein